MQQRAEHEVQHPLRQRQPQADPPPGAERDELKAIPQEPDAVVPADDEPLLGVISPHLRPPADRPDVHVHRRSFRDPVAMDLHRRLRLVQADGDRRV